MSSPPINQNVQESLALGIGFVQTIAPCLNSIVYNPPVGGDRKRRLINMRPANVSTRPWTSRWKPPTSWSREYFYVRTPVFYRQTQAVYTCVGMPNGVRIVRNAIPWNDISSNPAAVWPFSSDLLSRNTNDLLGKLKDENSVNLGLAFAERKQTERLLIRTMDRIGNSVRVFKAARKGDWKRVKRLSKERQNILASGRQLTQREAQLLRAPNAWLEVQYGWNPLMSDVYGAMHAVDKAQQERAYILKVSKSSKSIRPSRFDVVSNYSTDFRARAVEGSVVNEYIQQVVYYTLSSNELSTLSSLGLTNPVNLAWELVPFSFVVDWFLPLGDWFNTFDATLGKSFKSGTRTRVIDYPKTTLAGTVLGSFPGVTFVPDVMHPTGEAQYFRMSRSVLSTFPSPSPPAFKNPCSPSHVASALSLMASAFGRSVRPYVR